MIDCIVVDVETTGLVPGVHQIVSIGAVCSKTGEEFYKECSIFHHNEISNQALNINGFTEDQVRDVNKPNPLDIYIEFLAWCKGRSKILAGHNIGSFDVQFLKHLHELHNETTPTEWPFKYHYIDLHSMGVLHFKESLSHAKISVRLGLEPEPSPHNALAGARSEFNCIQKILEVYHESQV